MKKNIQQELLAILNELERHKCHNTVNINIIVAFKMHSKSLKFMNNFLCQVPHSIPSNKHILVFNNSVFNDFVNNDETEEKMKTRLINGVQINAKKIKKHIYMCVGRHKIDAFKSVLNRKSILPNNHKDFENLEDSAVLNNVVCGNYIKVYQMNNTINFKCGTLSKHSCEHIVDNIVAVMKFLNDKGFNMKYLYISQCMKKSHKLCVKK